MKNTYGIAGWMDGESTYEQTNFIYYKAKYLCSLFVGWMMAGCLVCWSVGLSYSLLWIHINKATESSIRI